MKPWEANESWRLLAASTASVFDLLEVLVTQLGNCAHQEISSHHQRSKSSFIHKQMAAAEVILAPEPTQPDFRYRHLSDVTCALGGLWRRRLYTDLTLVADGSQVRCHRVVLASASPYFHSRLFNGKRETSSDKLFINDVPRSVLSDVLDFVYSGECRLNKDNAEDLLRAATIFNMAVLKDMCDFFLKDTVSAKNAIRLFKMARATRVHRVEDEARKTIVENLPRLWKTKLFKQLSHHELVSLLRPPKNAAPQCDQDVVCGAVMVWVTSDKARRKHVLGEILRTTQIPSVRQEAIRQLLDESEGLHPQCVSLQTIQDTVRHLEDTSSEALEKTEVIVTSAAEQGGSQDVPGSSTPAVNSQQEEPKETYIVTRVKFGDDGQGDAQKTGEANAAAVAKPRQEPKPEDVLLLIGGEEIAADNSDMDTDADTSTSRTRPTQAVYAFHLSLRKWASLPPVPVHCDSGAASCARGDDVYVCGVGDARRGLVRLDTKLLTWHVLASMATGRRGHAIVVIGSFLYVVGGMAEDASDSSDGSRSSTAVVERYDTRNDCWKEVGSLAEPVWAASAVVLRNKIHLMGGFQGQDKDNAKPTSLVQTFDPATKFARVSSQLPFPMALTRAVVKSGAVYVMGPSGHILTSRDCWRFSLATSIPGFKRALFGLACDGVHLYVAGGRGAGMAHSKMLMVDVRHGTMLRLPQRLPSAVWGCGFLQVKVTLDREQLVEGGVEDSE